MTIEDEGVLRISPSQINLFLDEPAIWVLNKFHKCYADSGPAAWVGTAVEKGIESILTHGKSFEDAVAWAGQVFEQEKLRALAQFEPEDIEEERARVPLVLRQMVDLVIPLDGFVAFQTEITGEIEGVKIKAKIDFDFGTYDLDTKTTKRMISDVKNMSCEHVRQMAIYRILRGKIQKLAYATDKKAAIYIPTDDQYTIAEQEIRGAIQAMKTAWDYGQDVCQKIYCPRDFGHFRWDEKTRNKAKEIWR